MPTLKNRELYIEYTRIGRSMKVVAVDADTGTEVSFQAPLNASPKEMEQTAVNKLMYVLRKKGSGSRV